MSVQRTLKCIYMPTINRPKKKRKKPDYKPMFDYSKLYNSQQWKNLRNWYWRQHPLCEDCLLKGKTTPAVHVHHIHEISKGHNEQEKWDILTDEDNLVSLCLDCHLRRHGKGQHRHCQHRGHDIVSQCNITLTIAIWYGYGHTHSLKHYFFITY